MRLIKFFTKISKTRYLIKLFFGLMLVNGTLGWFRSLGDLSCVAILVASTEKENLAYAYSLRFIAINLALVFGPLIGASMASHNSPSIFYFAGVIQIIVG